MNELSKGIKTDITIREIIEKIKVVFQLLKMKWKFIFLAGLFGSLTGFVYSINQPKYYIAKLIFNLEESKNNMSSLGGLASIAGQFGVDVGGGSGGGVLSSDNIINYFKSPTLAREVLLSKFDSTKIETLADVYVKTHNLKKDFGAINFFESEIYLKRDNRSYNRRFFDSSINTLAELVIQKNFVISRPDKKSSFIEVNVKMQNEKLAQIYCERIVQRVVERYINLKIERQTLTVQRLQKRVDSISNLLRQKTVEGASLQSSSNTMDINPLFRTGNAVSIENTIRDKSLLNVIFASVSQNLEVAKFSLNQETPVIQIIDYPLMPLKLEKVSIIKTTFGMFIFFIIISSLLVIINKIYKTAMS